MENTYCSQELQYKIGSPHSTVQRLPISPLRHRIPRIGRAVSGRSPYTDKAPVWGLFIRSTCRSSFARSGVLLAMFLHLAFDGVRPRRWLAHPSMCRWMAVVQWSVRDGTFCGKRLRLGISIAGKSPTSQHSFSDAISPSSTILIMSNYNNDNLSCW